MQKAIRESIRMKMKKRGKKNKCKWWDSECREARKRVRKALGKSLEDRDGVRTKRDIYVDEKRNFKSLVKRKKEELEEKILKEVEEDRTERKFWKVVNESRKRGGRISKLITDREWLEHFIIQFGGERVEQEGLGNEGRR